MREGALFAAGRRSYNNENYGWFASRYAKFLYVDRIVVASGHSGLGTGAMLNKDLFGFAHPKGISNVTCEYNIDPPNPVSGAFHKKFGFREIGRQWVAGNSKLVSLQVADV